MTRDQVIQHTKEWLDLWNSFQTVASEHQREWPTLEQWKREQFQDAQDLAGPVMSLAYNRAKEALVEYTKEREAMFAAHDRMLETIEATLQESIKDIAND